MRILGINEDRLKSIDAYHTVFEMSKQPELWAEGIDIIRDNRKRIEDFMERIYSIEGLKIYLVGAGSSAKAASIVENYLERAAKRRVISVESTSLITHPDKFILDDSPVLLVSMGSSGNTTEGLAAVELFKERSKEVFQLLVICSPEGEIIRRYKDEENTLYIPIPKETKGKSLAATGEFTLLVQYALMILDIYKIDYYVDMFENIEADAKKFFNEDIFKVHALSNKKFNSVIALGSNALKNLASEMCLKVNELSGGMQNSEWYSILEFRHGPKLRLNSEAVVSFFFSSSNHAIKYEIDMLKECYKDKQKSTIVAISMDYNEQIDENCDYYFYFNKNSFQYIDNAHIIFQYSLYLQSMAILNSINSGASPDIIDKDGLVNKVAKGVIIYND